jgi:phosphatidylserine/phosphatidylglycerophosphate/cardiolipin synthase-like enzyme
MNQTLKQIVAALLYFCVMTVQAEDQTEISLPSAFGHTHFIVGMSQSDIRLLRETSGHNGAAHQASTYRQAYFSPDDGLAEKLIHLIDHEQERMQIAVFQFTNLDIARAIKRAHQRGVKIEIITDPLCLQDKFNKITWLSQEGITIYIYNPDANKTTLSNKMHNKFLICGKNIEDKELLWIGSFNFTKSADTANQESVVVLDDSAIINQFAKQYAKLKERSIRLQDFAKNHFIIQAWKPKDSNIKESHQKTSVAHNQRTRAHKRNQLKNIAVV